MVADRVYKMNEMIGKGIILYRYYSDVAQAKEQLRRAENELHEHIAIINDLAAEISGSREEVLNALLNITKEEDKV